MEKSKMKSKYILILLLSLFTILGMSMTTLADDTTTSGSSTGTAAGTSAGNSGYMGITPRSLNSSQVFDNVNLEMYVGTTQITSLKEVVPSDYDDIEYKIRRTKVGKDTVTQLTWDINLLTITFPDTLTIHEPIAPNNIISQSPSYDTVKKTRTYQYSVSGGSTAAADVESFLNGITFTLVNGDVDGYPPDGSAIEITASTGAAMTFYTDEKGNVHLYKRYDFTEVNNFYGRPGSTVVTWQEAYNFARQQPAPLSLSSQNPYGYLATITSQEEQNTIYRDIATLCGWLGGTRALLNGQQIVGGKDNVEISLNASDYDISIGTADKWYWADGPETGQSFYGQPTYSSGYNPIFNTVPNTTTVTVNNSTHTRSGNDSHAAGVDIPYNYFRNPENDGSLNPINFNVENFPKVEPNNSGGEAYLQFAWNNSPAWNDFKYGDNNSMTALYVEWGGYDGDYLIKDISLDIPQPVVVNYVLNWNGGDAVDSTKITPVSHYFFGQLKEINSSSGSPVVTQAVQTKASDFIDDNTTNTTHGEPVSSIGTLQANFEIMPSSLPASYPECSNKKEIITFVYWGIEMDLEYYSNNGVFPTGDPEGPITIKSRFMEPLEPLPATDHPTKHSSDLTDWTVNTNGSPDHFAETANIIEYQTTTPVSATVTRFTDASGKMQAYAVWTRNAWDLYFDGNGGQLNGVDTIQIPLVPGTRVANIDISTYLPDGVNQPTWFANAFLGWSNTGNIQNHGTESTPGTFTMTGDVYLKAEWLDLADYVNNYIKDTVIYKGESDAQSILQNSGLYPTYPDLLGNIHPIDLTIEPFYEATIEDGGVAEIRFSLNDPITGGPITLPKSFVDLYSLNRAYVKGGDTYYMFVGESAPMGAEFGVTGVAEFPDFSTRSISRQFFPLNYADGSVNPNAKGMYDTDFDTLFKDYFGDSYPMHWDAMVIVRERAELTKEEKLQVEASEFWVIVTDIYHKMQPGQIIEVNEYNYKDGGNLLTEKVSADAPYDRQIRVTPGPYIYMNPCILDRIKDDKAGSMDVYMPGRSLTFNSWEFETDPTVDGAKYDPRSYFNLRLHLESNEKVSALVPENTANMQFTLSMNRAWMAEPTFTVAVNDSLKAAAAEGKGLYLFNYNENTNELELVGAMSNSGNGNFSIKMNGAYGSYVILAGLPSNGKYRLTEQTNNLDEGTVQEVIINQQDSGKSVSNGQELNAISTTKKFQTEQQTTGEIEKASSSSGIAIVAGIGATLLAAGGGVFLYLKKRKVNNEQ